MSVYLQLNSAKKMFFKLAIKIGILAIEVALGIYSLALTDSLVVKFIFFTVSAVIIAFAVLKLTHRILPSDSDFKSEENLDQQNNKTLQP